MHSSLFEFIRVRLNPFWSVLRTLELVRRGKWKRRPCNNQRLIERRLTIVCVLPYLFSIKDQKCWPNHACKIIVLFRETKNHEKVFKSFINRAIFRSYCCAAYWVKVGERSMQIRMLFGEMSSRTILSCRKCSVSMLSNTHAFNISVSCWTALNLSRRWNFSSSYVYVCVWEDCNWRDSGNSDIIGLTKEPTRKIRFTFNSYIYQVVYICSHKTACARIHTGTLHWQCFVILDATQSIINRAFKPQQTFVNLASSSHWSFYSDSVSHRMKQQKNEQHFFPVQNSDNDSEKLMGRIWEQ